MPETRDIHQQLGSFACFNKKFLLQVVAWEVISGNLQPPDTVMYI